jgi:hypothetical protein
VTRVGRAEVGVEGFVDGGGRLSPVKGLETWNFCCNWVLRTFLPIFVEIYTKTWYGNRFLLITS